MRCLELQELMSQRLDGHLTPEEERRWAEHLGDCPECCRAWRQWQGVDALFSQAPMVHPPEYLTERVMARIERRHRPGALGVGMAVLGLGLAALAVVLILPLVVQVCLLGRAAAASAGTLPVLLESAASVWGVARTGAEAVRLLLWAVLNSQTLVVTLVYLGVATVAVSLWLHVAVFRKAQLGAGPGATA